MTALGETTTDARKALLAGKTVVFFGYVPCRLSPARNGTLQWANDWADALAGQWRSDRGVGWTINCLPVESWQVLSAPDEWDLPTAWRIA